MQSLFSWLHISDLCFRPGSGAGHDRVLDALRADLAEQALVAPDAILVTGDVAYAGQPDEYAAAREWLLEAAQAVGLGPDRVFVVAGNHDVDRKGDWSRAIRLVEEQRGRKKEGDAGAGRTRDRAAITERLKAFLAFAGAFGPLPADAGAAPNAAPPEGRLSWSHRVEGRGGLAVRLIGLNTALLSSGDADRGTLRLGAAQLDRARASVEEGEVVVALSHHPASGGWLADEPAAQRALQAFVDVHLTGHVHDPEAEQARAGADAGYLWVAAGATASKRTPSGATRQRAGLRSGSSSGPASEPAAPSSAQGSGRRLAWAVASIVRAGDGTLRVRITPRRWSAEKKLFRTDRALLGGAAFVERALREAARTPAAAPPAAVEPALRETVRMPAVAPPAHAAPVPERVARSPVPERVARSPAPEPVTRSPTPEPQRPPPAPEIRAAVRAGHFEGPGALPALPIHFFVGRDREMAALRDALADPGVGCVVATGLGGVGKTSLVQHFVATVARSMFDESAWIDARDLPAELGRVAKRFGWRHEERLPTVDEATRFLREALATRRVLLVIDNVDPGLVEVRGFPIPGGASRTVITSRIATLHEDLGRLARPLRLGTWDDAACRAHFREVVPALAAEADADLDRLARKVGGLPLAVRLLAKQLLRPDVTPRSLLARVEREPIAALDAGARGIERTVVATFHASVEGLAQAERRALSALAACAPATRASVVAAVAGIREEDADLALTTLAEQSLVEWIPEADRPFRLHDVVRMLLSGEPDVAAAEAAHTRWTAAYAAAHREPRDWQALERELPEVLAAVDRHLHGGDADQALAALNGVVALLDRRGMYDELSDRASRILDAAAPRGPTAAEVLGVLGLCQCSLGDFAEGMFQLARSLALAEELGWPEGQARALGGLGRCQAGLGEWEQAIALHRRSAAIHERLGMRDLHANDLGNVGLSYRRMGDLGAAIDHLERALAIQEELGLVEGRAEVLGGLGLCLRDIGEALGAIEYFGRALAIHEELGRRAGQAMTLGNLGNSHRALGDVRRAIDHLERALAIYEELGLADGEGAALGNLGKCYRALGDEARARSAFERALAALQRVGLPEDHPHVRAVLAALAHPRPAPRKDGPRRAR